MPPDEENKKSANLVKWALKKFEKLILGKYYDKNMLKTYEYDTIASMFYELDLNKLQQSEAVKIKWSNFDMALDYLYSVLNGLNNFYFTSTYHVSNNVNILLSNHV